MGRPKGSKNKTEEGSMKLSSKACPKRKDCRMYEWFCIKMCEIYEQCVVDGMKWREEK